MKKVKITVLKTTLDEELAAEYNAMLADIAPLQTMTGEQRVLMVSRYSWLYLATPAQVGGFSTIGAILTAVRAMPDRPQPPHRGARLLWDKILAGVAFVRRHSMAIFLAALVCVTVAYAAYQIGMRMFAGSAAQENTFYGGVQQIGEVSLTDENE